MASKESKALRDLIGLLTPEEADAMERGIEERRKWNREHREERRRRLWGDDGDT